MRRFQNYLSVSLLALAMGVVACDDTGDDDDTAEEASTGDGDGDGDGDTTTDDDDTTADTTDDATTGACFEQPPECQMLIECLDVILPGQDLAQFEAGGSCWCGTSDEANECRNLCISQLDTAVTQFPTEGACHGRVCPIEELVTDEPYGPPPCADGLTQMDGLPVAGSYCAPDCGGVSQTCAEHSQTIAQGTCMFNGTPNDLCALRCYVDPFVFASGTQCQCGAVCRPFGGSDADGNARGICTFD